MGAFKAYDIRGVYNRDFNKETVYKVGFFLPKLLPCKYVVVGRESCYNDYMRGILICQHIFLKADSINRLPSTHIKLTLSYRRQLCRTTTNGRGS